MVRLFSTRAVTVKKIEGRYYLQLPELELPVGNTQVPEAAQEALLLLNGIARLELGNFHPPKILGVSKRDPVTGTLQTYMSLGGKFEGRSRSYATVTIRLSDGTIIATNQAPAYVETLSKLADANEDLKHALTLFGQEKQHDWISLYNVFDAITQAFGEKKLIERQFATQSEIEDFKENTKPYRHGFREKPRKRHRKEPIRQKKEMTLAEAQAWILGILKAWVKELSLKPAPY